MADLPPRPPIHPGAPPLLGSSLGSSGVLESGRRSVGFELIPRLVGAAVALGLSLVIWAGLTTGGDSAIVADRFPSIGEVIDGFRMLLDPNNPTSRGGDTLPTAVRNTVWRYLVGLSMGLVVGGAAGFTAGLNKWTRSFVDALASFFRSVPAVAFAMLSVIWSGRDDRAIITVVALVTLWTSLGAAAEAANNQRRGTGNVSIGMATAVRQAIVLGWWAAIGAEIVGARSGLGTLAVRLIQLFDLGAAVATLIVIGVVGMTFETAGRILVYLARSRSR